jgi:beta-phosphoglucomutase-like phosphatase (HAD superfamily)
MFDDVRAVLFDLDGTLIDSAPDLGAAADRMRVERGLPSLPLEKYRPMAGAGARGMLGIAFGMTPESRDYEAMREEFFVNYENAMTERTVIFEGVPALIASLLELGIRCGNGKRRGDLRLSRQQRRHVPLERRCADRFAAPIAPALEKGRAGVKYGRPGAALVSTWVRNRSGACRGSVTS